MLPSHSLIRNLTVLTSLSALRRVYYNTHQQAVMSTMCIAHMEETLKKYSRDMANYPLRAPILQVGLLRLLNSIQLSIGDPRSLLKTSRAHRLNTQCRGKLISPLESWQSWSTHATAVDIIKCVADKLLKLIALSWGLESICNTKHCVQRKILCDC